MITILIYLKDVKRPFRLDFENKRIYAKFCSDLQSANATDIIDIGGFMFAKSEFKYCLQK